MAWKILGPTLLSFVDGGNPIPKRQTQKLQVVAPESLALRSSRGFTFLAPSWVYGSSSGFLGPPVRIYFHFLY